MEEINKFKIAYCLPSLYIAGGMERVLTLKANYFAENFNYDIWIVLTDGKEKKPYFELSPKINVINLDLNFDEMFGQPFYKRVVQYLRKQYIYKKKLRKCLCELRPDITVSMLRREITFLPFIPDGSRKIGEAHVNRVNIHNAFGNKMNLVKRFISKYWMSRLMRALGMLDKFVILTHEDVANWGGLDNIEVINNPLTFFPERTSTCCEKNVIAVGRYLPEKGMDLLVDAWERVSRKHPDWVLKIYGDGPRNVLLDQIVRLNVSQNCFLEKPVANIVDKYLESSVLVLSSRFEGFGMVMPEAMACGLPVVAFSSYGPREIIHPDKDGILVENGNVEEFAKKICYLIENEQSRKKMGEQARINVQRLKIEYIACQWRDLFESLFAEKRK